MLKQILVGMFMAANRRNRANILKLAGHEKSKKILDLGCDDGQWTFQVAKSAQAEEIFGIEINPVAAAAARKNGIQVTVGDLADPLPFADSTFDLVHTNQVIEHVPDIDQFAREAFRVLKPGGRLILSTENGSAWHNVFAAAMGWQIFSLTNLSSLQSGVGNPLALHRGSTEFSNSWTHKVIFNYRGLIEFLALHGFKNISVRGAGYYPLPSILGDVDRRHAHLLALSGQK